MVEYILRFFRSFAARPQHEELLIPVRVDQKRSLYKRR